MEGFQILNLGHLSISLERFKLGTSYLVCLFSTTRICQRMTNYPVKGVWLRSRGPLWNFWTLYMFGMGKYTNFVFNSQRTANTQRLTPKVDVDVFCMCGRTVDVITHARFQMNRFRGFGALGGRKWPSPLTWHIVLTTVYALACYTLIIIISSSISSSSQ